MPIIILKKVGDYVSFSKKYLLFIIILLFIFSLIQNYVENNGDYIQWIILQVIVIISVSGYGMLITRNRINHEMRLPKIKIKDIIVLGVKSSIVFSVYVLFQYIILYSFGSALNFPVFDLEEMMLNWNHTIHMLFSHNPVDVLVFLILGSLLFYVTAFFMEIALAKLADTNRFWSAFNLLSIKRSIDVIGWKNYTKEYTVIIVVIVFLSYLISIDLPITFLDSIIDMILSFLIFVTQYLGIGAVYAEIKDLESKNQA